MNADEHNVWTYYQSWGVDGFQDSYARLGYLVARIPRGSTVLNIGIGDCSFERLALAKGLVVRSLDPDQASVEKCKNDLKIEADCGSIEAIPLLSQALDVVVLSEVIEHLTPEQTQQGLSEIRRVLKRGGLLLGTVPANENLQSSVVACPHCGQKFHRWGHKQSFSDEGLRDLLTRYFSDVKISHRKFIPWKSRGWVYKFSGLLKIAMLQLGMTVENSNYAFEAKVPTSVISG